eukprot:6483108-Amphidinium_carterae.1
MPRSDLGSCLGLTCSTSPKWEPLSPKYRIESILPTNRILLGAEKHQNPSEYDLISTKSIGYSTHNSTFGMLITMASSMILHSSFVLFDALVQKGLFKRWNSLGPLPANCRLVTAIQSDASQSFAFITCPSLLLLLFLVFLLLFSILTPRDSQGQ